MTAETRPSATASCGSSPYTPDLARGGCGQAEQHVDGAGLAGAVRAEQGDDLAGADLQADAVDGGDRAESLTHLSRSTARAAGADRNHGLKGRCHMASMRGSRRAALGQSSRPTMTNVRGATAADQRGPGNSMFEVAAKVEAMALRTNLSYQRVSLFPLDSTKYVRFLTDSVETGEHHVTHSCHAAERLRRCGIDARARLDSRPRSLSPHRCRLSPTTCGTGFVATSHQAWPCHAACAAAFALEL